MMSKSIRNKKRESKNTSWTPKIPEHGSSLKTLEVLPVKMLDFHSALEKSTYQWKCLHQTLAPVLILSQCFGLIPVYGITGSTPSNLNFKWMSLKVLHTFIILAGIMFCGFGFGIEFIDQGVNFFSSIAVIFYICAVVATLLFITIAVKWPKLMKEWAVLELNMRSYPVVSDLQRQIHWLIAILLISGTVEHILSVISTSVDIARCTSKGNNLQKYLETRFAPLFKRTRFTFPVAIGVQLFNWIATFVWNFVDIFIIIMSMAITTLFRRITQRLKMIHILVAHESVWRTIREDYTKVQVMSRTINSAISPLILLACASNLCFICAQLLQSLNPVHNLAAGIYFYYSLIYLVTRTVFLTIVVAKVHESSQEPLIYLFAVPSYSYCVEVSRFVHQVTSEFVAMTGMNFFSIRREIIFTVAGTIITYELVLIQFNALNNEPSDSSEPQNISVPEKLYPCIQYLYDKD